MLVSWDWLTDYVQLAVEPDELALRLAMAGLNHEATMAVDDDVVLDLEVTSNRSDCLGHIGVAREIAVLTDQELRLPAIELADARRAGAIEEILQVENRCPDGCPEYTARIVRGVRVGPSPDWLQRRLHAVGINSVNNIVDITNYVLMECGQPLHAFDLRYIRGKRIIVRYAEAGEKLEAIDHRTYALDERMVVIADEDGPLAIGGIMGGAASEVREDTLDLVIEAARFAPLAIRRAARKLKLHSPSSFRFERTPDPAAVDWASRRCCQLILEIAGGELVEGVAHVGHPADPRSPIRLRWSQIPRVLGIDIPQDRARKILNALGFQLTDDATGTAIEVLPPTWRNDVSREADLIEELARIYGYDQIPENVPVPLAMAMPRAKDVALERIRHVLSARGIDEAMTPSVTPSHWEELGSPWSDRPPLTTETQLLVGAKCLRRSLIPSLLSARYQNQTQSIRNAELYEVATIFLPDADPKALPDERTALGIVTRGDIQWLKGVIEEILHQVTGRLPEFHWDRLERPAGVFDPHATLAVAHHDIVLGYVGLVVDSVRERLDLDQPVAAAELDIGALTLLLEPVRTARPISPYPAVDRDLNFVVAEELPWAELAAACCEAGGELLQNVEFREIYRNPQKDGPGKKRVLLTLHFQSLDRTLTGDEVDAIVAAIVDHCRKTRDAHLLAA
ncbi:MAG: phenylalanine--tRNA ligase beta subunit [Pirellulaceae bacterium]|nr:MAG: phenylalanine--tRNA ligase beta subunit [Pirellulaceae bacterium]